MKRFLAVVIVSVSLLFVGVAYAQKVDQGAPGKQGAWPVTGTTISTGSDGGVVMTYPGTCAQTAADGGLLHKSTAVGTSAVPVPTTSTASRISLEVCNSLQNTGTPLLKCRADGTAPVMAVTNAGDVLGIGDCRVFNIPASNVLQCIADAASTNALSFECVVP
jgi:hypothetical protein